MYYIPPCTAFSEYFNENLEVDDLRNCGECWVKCRVS